GDATRDRVRGNLEASRRADVVECLLDLRRIVAVARSLEDVQPWQRVAVVDARPLVDVEQRAAACPFCPLALLHRERIDARLVRRGRALGEPLDERRRALAVFVATRAGRDRRRSRRGAAQDERLQRSPRRILATRTLQL